MNVISSFGIPKFLVSSVKSRSMVLSFQYPSLFARAVWPIMQKEVPCFPLTPTRGTSLNLRHIWGTTSGLVGSSKITFPASTLWKSMMDATVK